MKKGRPLWIKICNLKKYTSKNFANRKVSININIVVRPNTGLINETYFLVTHTIKHVQK